MYLDWGFHLINNNNLQNFIPKSIGNYQIKLNSYHQNDVSTTLKGTYNKYIVWVKMYILSIQLNN